MLKNYLKTAIRSLLKHKGYTVINIAGLGIGMAVFMLLIQYVHFEKSYESFVTGKDQIYRVSLESYLNNELLVASAENFPGVGPALKQDLPEILDFARLYNLGYKNNVVITNRNAQPSPVALKHRRFLYADSSFLSMFGYEMIHGDPVTALSQPLKAVISEEYANKYFGNESPLGKLLLMQDDDFNREEVEITGVFKDLPVNTHLKFDVLFSYRTLFGRGEWAPGRYDQSWSRNDMYTFVKLQDGVDPDAVETKFPELINRYLPDLAKENRQVKLKLQPITEIHLHSDLAEEPEPNGNARVVSFLGLIGVLVLLIAWINYINLSTARALERAREVGVRKVTGAARSQLVGQFLVESLCVNLVALLFAITLAVLSLPLFNQVSGQSLSYNHFLQPWFLLLLPALWFVGAMASGMYPAYVMSSFRPVSILKGAFRHSKSGTLLRKSLVVIQFAASVILIVGTLMIYRQLNFMLNRDIGMNIDQVLVVERPAISSRNDTIFRESIDAFKAELRKHPSIEAISSSLTVPGKQREYKGTAKRLGAADHELATMRINSMDYEFLEVFQMDVIAGRGFSQDFPSDDDTAIVVTASASRALGFQSPEDAIGQTLDVAAFGWKPIVVGVVNDYHQVSLKESLDPSAFFCSLYGGEFYSMRVNTADLQSTLAHVEKAWNNAFPGNPFQYFFLDDYFNRQYSNERRFGKLVGIFALLAVIVGCLGLFGLSGYMIAQRTKEIGIRKVLGASVHGLVGTLTGDLLKLVAVAIIVAIPLSWWALSQWLQDFPYRTIMGWDVFLLAGIIAIAIATITVSIQSIKAASVNPVDSLRSE